MYVKLLCCGAKLEFINFHERKLFHLLYLFPQFDLHQDLDVSVTVLHDVTVENHVGTG